MEMIFEYWPFKPGDQISIFKIGIYAVTGMIVLNLYAAIDSGRGLKHIIKSIWVESYTQKNQ